MTEKTERRRTGTRPHYLPVLLRERRIGIHQHCMFELAVSSLRHHRRRFVASFVAMFLGAAILMTFASMLDTATASGVDALSRETLITVAAVVGGWGLIIVTFAVMSTLTLLARQRDSELALLRSVGATGAQVGKLIIGEAAAIAAVAVLVAIPPAILGGRAALLTLLADTGQVMPGVDYHFGPIALTAGASITLVAASIAAAVTAWRTARARTTAAMVTAATGDQRMGPVPITAGCLLLAAGTTCGILTATVLSDMGIELMAVAGQAVILSAVGWAVLAPALLKGAIGPLAAGLRRIGGAPGYLAVLSMRQRTHQAAHALVPIVLFSGIATGTLSLQLIENSALAEAGIAKSVDDKGVETLNLVVVGMIALFAAIMLINTLVAATTNRRREFGQQRLAGSTPAQLLGMVGTEGAVLTATGLLFGSIAAVVGVVPYSVARTGDAWPDSTIGVYLGVVALAATLTMVTSLSTARRTIRTPAVEAVS